MSKPKAFCMWSGGKDSHLALMCALKQGYDGSVLLTFFDRVKLRSLSHALPVKLLEDQVKLVGIEWLKVFTTRENYEASFRESMGNLRREGITHGVFGDIYLQEHRVWIEKVCGECSIEPLFPLWGKSIEEIFEQQKTIRSLIVSIDKQKIEPQWLGTVVNDQFKEYLSSRGMDICGEQGEYHTFVLESRLMKGTVQIQTWKRQEYDGYIGLDIETWTVFDKTLSQRKEITV